METAVRLATEALEADRRDGRRREEAMSLSVLSMAAFMQGDLDEGVRLGFESAAVAKSDGFTWWHGVTLAQVAECLIVAGKPDAAAQPLRDGLRSLAAVDDRVNLPLTLPAAAAIAAHRGDAPAAGLFWGALEAAAESEPRPSTDGALGQYRTYVDPVRGDAFDEARARGRSLSLQDAVARAVAYLEDG